MSEKVASGGNSLEELEQEQVLLDWQDLPSFGRVENGVQAGSTEAIKTDNITETSDTVAEQQARERLSARARGELLLRATAESLPIEEVRERKELESGAGGDADALASVIEGENVDGGVDTVVLRAEQALGREQFLTLVYDLGDLAYTEEPDDVMRKFREEAQKYSAIDAGDLWEAAVRQAKVEYFGGPEDRAEMKFYYSTSLDGLKDILRSGKLARQDGESSPLKSDLRFSYDRKTPEGWQSGFAAERDVKSHEVTLMFDSSLIDEESFMAFGKSPSASMVDWEKSCLGVVASDTVDMADLRRVVRLYGDRKLPVYGEKFTSGDGMAQDWGDWFISAGALQQGRDWYREQIRHSQELSGKLYGHEADGIIEKNVSAFAERVSMPKLEAFYEKYSTINTAEGRREMIEDLVEYFGGTVFGIGTTTEIEYFSDPNSDRVASCTAPEGKLRVNEAQLEEASWAYVIEVVGHEMDHRFQLERSNHYAMSLLGSNVAVTEYEELCYYNYNHMNYISADIDVVGYVGQFIEREAYGFGEVIREKCAAVERKMRTPSERARRVAKALGGKIMNLSKKARKNG